jgi:small-conductance mechanosensitive channel
MTSPRALSAQITELWSSSITWIDDHTFQIVVSALLGAVLVALLMGLRIVGKRFARRHHDWLGVLGRALASMRIWFMVAVAAKVIATYAHAPVDIAQTVQFVFVIAATLQAALFARALILGAVEVRANETDPAGGLANAIGLIRVLVSAVLFVIAAILILSNLGFDATGLLAGLGIGGIAIGLAAQGIFSDLFAALSILLDRPFRRGDTIRYETTTGTIEAIGLKSTRIRALSGEEVIVSNTNLLSKEVRNFARSDHRRIFQTLGIVYHTPIALCAGLPQRLEQLVSDCEGATFVRAGLLTFGASSLDFEFVYDIASDDPPVILSIKNAVNLAILGDFAVAGIAFAYPTQTTFTAAPDGHLVMPYAALPTQAVL